MSNKSIRGLIDEMRQISELNNRRGSNCRWYAIKWNELAQEYDKEYIAIDHNKVISHDKDEKIMQEKMKSSPLYNSHSTIEHFVNSRVFS